MDAATIIPHIRAIPDEIGSVLEGLTDAQLRHRPGADDWSLVENACHLRDAADEECTRVDRMLAEEHPLLPGYDEQQRAIDRLYQQQDPRELAAALNESWSRYADKLAALPPTAWARTGTHPTRGESTIATRAERVLEHAREHLAQMSGVRELSRG